MSVLRVNSITGKDDDRSSGFPLDFTGNLATFAEVSALPEGSLVSGSVVNHSGTFKFYNGTSWQLLNELAFGGQISTFTTGGVTYRVHTFLSSGTFSLNTVLTDRVDILIVAGGGAAFAGYGGDSSGGGGGGGLLYGTGVTLTIGTYVCVVGAGGTVSGSGNSQTTGVAGNSTITSSAITTQTAVGGGCGGAQYIDHGNGDTSGADGGSGGGGGMGAPTLGDGGSGTQANSSNPVLTAFKFDGTGGSNTNSRSGGGGGAGGIGANSGGETTDGSGGIGKTFTDIWESGGVTYAKGGNGPASSAGAGVAGGANTGNGATGAGNGTAGAAGGSGIVVIRYAA
jgi:hypothetical protein